MALDMICALAAGVVVAERQTASSFVAMKKATTPAVAVEVSRHPRLRLLRNRLAHWVCSHRLLIVMAMKCPKLKLVKQRKNVLVVEVEVTADCKSWSSV